MFKNRQKDIIAFNSDNLLESVVPLTVRIHMVNLVEADNSNYCFLRIDLINGYTGRVEFCRDFLPGFDTIAEEVYNTLQDRTDYATIRQLSFWNPNHDA